MSKAKFIVILLVLVALVVEVLLLVDGNFNYNVALSQEEKAYLQSISPIKMAVDPDWKPYEEINDKGEYVGIAADYIKLLQQKLNVEFMLVPTKDWSESIEVSKAEKVTILPLLNRSIEREKWLVFSEPLIIDDNVIIGRNDSSYITNLKDVTNMTVVLPKGTSVEERLRTDYPNLNIILADSEEDAFAMVLNKQADFTIRSLIVSEYNIRREGWFELKIIGKLNGYTNYLSIGINKSESKLKPILDKGILSITEQERTDILNKHVPLKVEIKDYRSRVLYAFWITLGILISILIGFTFIFFRNTQLERFNKKMTTITKRYEALSALARTYFWEINIGGFITYVSPEVTKIVGYSIEEIEGRHHSEFLPELNAYLTKEKDELIQDVIAIEIIHITKDNLPIWVKVDAMALLNKDNEIIGYSGSCTDIERRKLLENKLIESKSETELAYYQAQITPHFLYNTMSAIALYCKTDPPKASSLIMELSYFLRTRFDIKNTNKWVGLSQEIDLIKAYLNIEKVRFQDRLNVIYEIDQALLNQQLPPLILQPLVENAVNHGILMRIEGGVIRILAFKVDDHVRIEVIDTGVGISQSKIEELELSNKYSQIRIDDVLEVLPEKGVGLANIQERLLRIYDSKLEIYINDHGGTTVAFDLPMNIRSDI